MIELNARFLFFLSLTAVIGVLLAIDRPDGREILGLLSGAAIGALLVYSYQRWVKRWLKR